DSLPTATRGEAYGTVTLAALGGTEPASYAFTVTSPTPVGTVPLPNGLTLQLDGQLSGLPAPDAEGGLVSFTVEDLDTSETAERTLALNVRDLLAVVSSVATIDAVAGETVVDETPLTTTGGLAPLTFSLSPSTLPPGLEFDPATGRV